MKNHEFPKLQNKRLLELIISYRRGRPFLSKAERQSPEKNASYNKGKGWTLNLEAFILSC